MKNPTRQVLIEVLEKRIFEWTQELNKLFEHFRLAGEKHNFDRALKLARCIEDAETELKNLRGEK